MLFCCHTALVLAATTLIINSITKLYSLVIFHHHHHLCYFFAFLISVWRMSAHREIDADHWSRIN